MIINQSQPSEVVDYVSVEEFAASIGMCRSNALKFLKKSGVHRFKRRLEGKRGQLSIVVAEEDAGRLIAERKAEGFVATTTDGLMVPERFDKGFFYAIQLIPDIFDRRVKLGFAMDAEGRLSQHRTAAPTATILCCWPSRRTWEFAAIDSITRDGCVLVSGEVFDFDDVESIKAKGDSFFGLLPPG